MAIIAIVCVATVLIVGGAVACVQIGATKNDRTGGRSEFDDEQPQLCVAGRR